MTCFAIADLTDERNLRRRPWQAPGIRRSPAGEALDNTRPPKRSQLAPGSKGAVVRGPAPGLHPSGDLGNAWAGRPQGTDPTCRFPAVGVLSAGLSVSEIVVRGSERRSRSHATEFRVAQLPVLRRRTQGRHALPGSEALCSGSGSVETQPRVAEWPAAGGSNDKVHRLIARSHSDCH